MSHRGDGLYRILGPTGRPIVVTARRTVGDGSRGRHRHRPSNVRPRDCAAVTPAAERENEEVTMTVVSTALAIATAAHAAHVDKAGQPYLGHPVRVAAGAVELAEPVGLDLDVVEAVALLHDVVEDSDVTLDDLAAAGLPPAVVGPVGLLTRAKDAPRGPYLEAIASDPVALVVKLADTLDNTDPSVWRHCMTTSPLGSRRNTPASSPPCAGPTPGLARRWAISTPLRSRTDSHALVGGCRLDDCRVTARRAAAPVYDARAAGTTRTSKVATAGRLRGA